MRQLSLLQIAMDSYYKLRQLFYYEVPDGLLQIEDRYYKVRWIYYKVRPLLQIATVQMSPEWKLGWALLMNNQQRKRIFLSYSTSKPVTVILSSTSIMKEKIIINLYLLILRVEFPQVQYVDLSEIVHVVKAVICRS